MKNILAIVKRDLLRVRHSVIACIVCMGLVLVPVLYAWFNIAGSWDPYGNTGDLKVAVANCDEGYKSDLIPVTITLGDRVSAALRENDQLGWEFVSKKEALEGVKSGKYYAAVVIPKDFSASMMTLFSGEVHHAQIVYYENQKASAIAPRVTDKGASTVRQQIDQTFTSTVDDIGLATTSSLLDYVDGDEVVNYVSNLSKSLGSGVENLRSAASTLGSFATLTKSTSDLVSSAGNQMNGVQSSAQQAGSSLSDARGGIAKLSNSLDDTAHAVDEALQQGSRNFENVSASVDGVLTSSSAHAKTTAKQLKAQGDALTQQSASTKQTADELNTLADRAEASGLTGAATALRSAATSLHTLAQQQATIGSRIAQIAADLESGATDIDTSKNEVHDLIAQARSSISQVKNDYNTTLKGDISALSSSVNKVGEAARGISSDLDRAVTKIAGSTGTLAQDLQGVDTALTDTAATLSASADDLQQIRHELETAAQSGDIQKIRELIGSDPTALASALSSPVSLQRHAVYHIQNYGSAMAPFYTVLSLWVGGIVLAAMLKVTVDEDVVKRLSHVRLHQLYFGRYCLFALLALAQATLVCVGEIAFFGIQCNNPWLYVLTGWLAALVFSNIIYTLTVSFGDIGKALAVVLLVMQVAGSGGTFPIQMTADFFQAVYPWLPFTHAINAMHTAMAGGYDFEYLIEMLKLAAYLVPSLALGLLLRRPVVKANTWVIERLEATKLM